MKNSKNTEKDFPIKLTTVFYHKDINVIQKFILRNFLLIMPEKKTF